METFNWHDLHELLAYYIHTHSNYTCTVSYNIVYVLVRIYTAITHYVHTYNYIVYVTHFVLFPLDD